MEVENKRITAMAKGLRFSELRIDRNKFEWIISETHESTQYTAIMNQTEEMIGAWLVGRLHFIQFQPVTTFWKH